PLRGGRESVGRERAAADPGEFGARLLCPELGAELLEDAPRFRERLARSSAMPLSPLVSAECEQGAAALERDLRFRERALEPRNSVVVAALGGAEQSRAACP